MTCSRTFAWAGILFVVAAILPGTPVASMEFQPGVVTRNTFVLSRAPNTPRDGRLVFSLVGYLPVGTRVYYELEPVQVRNLRSGEYEPYYDVRSSIGVGGLIPESRFTKVADKVIAVPVASYELPLYQPFATAANPARRLTIGRYDGNYLEIVGDGNDMFYDAILYRPQPSAGLPAMERVRLNRYHVDEGAVVLVGPGGAPSRSPPVAAWSGGVPFEDTLIDTILAEAEDRFEDEIDEIRAFLGDLSSLQCLLKASANAEFGFRIFGNGLSFALEFNIKEEDHLYSFESYSLRKPDGTQQTFTLLRNVVCDGSTPERMVRLTLQQGVYDPTKREYVRLSDMKASDSPWIVSLTGRVKPMRMILVNGEDSCLSALRELQNLINNGDSFVKGLPTEDQELLLNFLLMQMGYFEHRKVFAPFPPLS